MIRLPDYHFNNPSKAICLISLTSLSLIHISCVNSIGQPTGNVNLSKSIPKTWDEVGKGYHGKISTGWLADFKNPRMSKLVQEAVNAIPSLKASEARLRAAWETTQAADADFKPSVSTGASTSRRRAGNLGETRSIRSSYGLNASTSWELDLWGRIRDRVDATRADFRADEHDLRSARLSLAANTAKAWCNLITSEQNLDLAKKTLDSFEKNNRIVERNYKAGAGTRSLAVQLSRSNVASAKSTLRSRQLQRNNAARDLEVLLGRYPSAEIKSTNELPFLRTSVPTGIPAQLLSRRPDVAAAELAVYSSAKRADIARKSLLPAVRFSAGISSGSGAIREVFNIHNLVTNAAANLSQTVYQGGELKANAKAALERNQAAIYTYANVVVRASQEIEESIATDRALREQEKFLVQQTKSSTLAETQATRDYSEGIEGVGILEVLESQRRANNARSSLINIRNRRLQNRIDLYLALGGDFATPAQ